MTASKTPKRTAATASSRPAAGKAVKPGNGLSGFSLDMSAANERAKLAALPRTRSALRRSAGPALDLARQDPETAAKNYLDQALESTEVRSFARPVASGVPSEFKSLGTEVSPLTGTTLSSSASTSQDSRLRIAGGGRLGGGNECCRSILRWERPDRRQRRQGGACRRTGAQPRSGGIAVPGCGDAPVNYTLTRQAANGTRLLVRT